MHPMCYVNLSAVEAEQPEPSPYQLKLQSILATVPTAKHADLDKIMEEHFRIRLRGRRDKLAQRRAHISRMLEGRIRRCQRNQLSWAKLNNFIGPLTIQQRNGHPF